MYCGYITTLKNVRSHPNADRMKLADCFGNTVCVGLNANEGDVVIYFPTDGQLSVEFCREHDLVRRKDENGNPAGGYLDPDKRNIKAIKLRGEKSDGITFPLTALEFTGVDISTFNIGDTITVVNGVEICRKYIPRGNRGGASGEGGNRTRKHKEPVAPQFAEHADTEQLAYNLSAFKPGDEIEISLKMHGTSQRTGYLPKLVGYNDSVWRKFVNKIIMGLKVRKNWGFKGRYALYHSLKHDGEPIYEYGYVTGTRRVVLDDFEGGFYGSNEFREQHAKRFEDKLWKGETVYYEVVGFTHTGQSIMGSCNNKKLNDKEFVKQYGEETIFSYGCEPNPVVHEGYNDSAYGYQNEYVTYKAPQSDMYVYRMTCTTPDGNVVEYTPDFMRYRCELMGVKCVPVFEKFIIPEYVVGSDGSTDDLSNTAGEYVKDKAEEHYEGTDPVGKTHIREGVVVRIVNRPKFTAYKHKNFAFKVLEGIVKDTAAAPDMEEAQDA